MFGWDGKSTDGELVLQNVAFTHRKSVGFLDCFNQLNELALDMALIPLADIPYNTEGKSFIKYLELSVFGIPVVASNTGNILTNGHTGQLVTLKSFTPNTVHTVGYGHPGQAFVFKSCVENFTYSKRPTKNVKLLKNIDMASVTVITPDSRIASYSWAMIVDTIFSFI